MEQKTMEEAVEAYNSGGISRLRRYIERQTGQEEIKYLERLEKAVGNRNMNKLELRFADLTPSLIEKLAE